MRPVELPTVSAPLEKNKPAVRDTNLELYRVLVMLAIVAHHYVVNSGLTAQMYKFPESSSSLFLYLLGAWGKTGINCFVLITGYFMCGSAITAKKFAKLLLEVLFYRIAIRLIFWLTGYEAFTPAGLREILLPVTAVDSGFTDCYLVFFLLIPFLNILLRNLSRKQHGLLVLLCLSVYTGLASFSWASVRMNYVTWFCVLYILAAYIRLHPREIFTKTYFWAGAAVLSLGLSVASILLRRELVTTSKVYFYLSDSNKILALTNALTSFLFFKNLKMKNRGWINALGATTYGVLLIHANCDSMRRWLWQDVLNNAGWFGSAALLAHAVVSVAGIFTVCSLIDRLRIRFLEKPFFRFAWPYLAGQYDRVKQKMKIRLHTEE